VAVEVSEQDEGRILDVRATGRLTTADYERLLPMVERSIARHGKLRVRFEMHDFHGWSAGALWEDIKFDMRHFRDIERLAMVGDRQWEAGMAAFCRPFTTAAIRYFDRSEGQAADDWLRAEAV